MPAPCPPFVCLREDGIVCPDDSCDIADGLIDDPSADPFDETEWVGQLVITLQDRHRAVVREIIRKRQQNAVDRGRPGANGAPAVGRAALALHIKGTPAEGAAKLFLNPCVWHAFKDGSLRDLPDLEDWIDVKAIEDPTHRLLVQKDDPKDWAYFLVLKQHPTYTMLCWTWGYEAKQERFWGEPRPQRPAYCVKQNDPIMKPPHELLALHRQRRGEPPCT